MAIQIGQVNPLTVKRETDISYTLTDGKTDVFLHFNQTPNPLRVGETVDAFLYYDQKKRLCATLQTPLITTTTPGKVEVVSVNFQAGVFVSIGIVKDILLSKDYLPSNIHAWPQVGDSVFCILREKSDQLIARLMQKEDAPKSTSDLQVNQTVMATVNRITDDGIGLYTDQFHYLFIHKSQLRKNYRIGESIEVKVIFVNRQGDYNGTTIMQKEFMRLNDSDEILRILKSRGGVLPLGNSSTPEAIERELHMSKSAFKRATGNLYKKRLIAIDENRITLIDQEEKK